MVFYKLLILSLFICLGQGQLRVELVQVLFRHGERAPLQKEMYPKDSYDATVYEPWGIGQLTNEGKMREYRIGKMLRERYDTYLGEIYHPEDIYARSTDIDRTKMSLQLVLAGLYPPAKSQMWNPQLPWLAIPTHYVPERVDSLLRPNSSYLYEEAINEAMELPEIKEKIITHKKLYEYLSEKTGLNITLPVQVYEVYNLLIAQKTMNLTLPNWCTKEILEEMADCVVLEYEIRSHTTKLKKLTAGILIKKYIENMGVNVERPSKRKMYLYSAHEVNLAAFLRAHGIQEPKIPVYGMAILFEKLRDAEGKLFVRMLVWTGATEELINLNIGNGEDACPLDIYLKLVENVIPSEAEIQSVWDRITKEELENLFLDRVSYN